MKYRTGTILISTGLISFGLILYKNSLDLQNTSPLGYILLFSCLLLILLGSICFDTDSTRIYRRKCLGHCWACSKKLDIDPDSDYIRCSNCGHDHDREAVILYLEIAKKQQRLREMGYE